MIVKLTDEKDLIALFETQDDKEWFDTNNSIPLSVMITGFSHSFIYCKEWNKEHVGNYLWYKVKYNQ